jgi:hypothetical protein
MDDLGKLNDGLIVKKKSSAQLQIASFDNFARAGNELSYHNPIHIAEFWDLVELSLTNPMVGKGVLGSLDSVAQYLAFNSHLFSEEHIRKHFDPREVYRVLLQKFD